MDTKTDRVIARIDDMLDAFDECGRDDYVQLDREECKILICVLEEALKVLCEKRGIL